MRRIDTRAFTRATRSTSRDINRQIVLNLIREHQPISRADVARRMGVPRGTAASLVNQLIAEGSLVEGPVHDAPRGRKPVMLFVRTDDRLVIAVDVRSSRTYVLLADLATNPIAEISFETPASAGELIEDLARAIEQLRSTHGSRGELEGVGVAVSGMVDDAGTILYAPQLGWRLVPLRDELAEATGLPVHVENASNACALGHMWLVRQEGASAGDFAYVNVSDGVGVGLVVGGQLVRGSGHAAGEFGHIPIESDGPVCLCGSRGCWEIFTSNLATLARYLGHEPSAEESRRLMRQREISMRDVVTRARAGDAAARVAIGATARYLGIGLGILVNTLNPARIIVGGEICGAWELLADELARAVAVRGMTIEAQRTPIVPEAASVRPRLRGAIALVAAPLFAAPQVA